MLSDSLKRRDFIRASLSYFSMNAKSQKVAMQMDRMIIHVMKQAANGGL
ncbi:hypothetical protein [Acidithiobacillus sulfuriphilus]